MQAYTTLTPSDEAQASSFHRPILEIQYKLPFRPRITFFHEQLQLAMIVDYISYGHWYSILQIQFKFIAVAKSSFRNFSSISTEAKH